jgi:hypothetical protein
VKNDAGQRTYCTVGPPHLLVPNTTFRKDVFLPFLPTHNVSLIDLESKNASSSSHSTKGGAGLFLTAGDAAQKKAIKVRTEASTAESIPFHIIPLLLFIHMDKNIRFLPTRGFKQPCKSGVSGVSDGGAIKA